MDVKLNSVCWGKTQQQQRTTQRSLGVEVTEDITRGCFRRRLRQARKLDDLRCRGNVRTVFAE
ncbi:hypothetical protein ZHAS_00007177 [Anopheles sinensis]|uniref:Uncharacterized protein n=1 Tax=Anopheles sinensis TaxID=74873 RepID=A0A084VPB5_ANOSI|nr:hypothetical protein ZHAS_00007177 [Anopheles sinensis]